MSEPPRGAEALRGRTVIVTGGAVRVGAAISRAVAAAGARLAIHCHSHLERGRRLAEELGQRAEAVVAVQRDLREPDAARQLFDEVAAALGEPSVLVNNAAILAATPLRDYDAATASRLLEVNLAAPLRLMAEMARRSPAEGVIVNIVDAAAQRPWSEHGAYVAAKAGLLQASRVAARELAPSIRVNVVNPGTVILRDEEKAHLDRLLQGIPLGRIGQGEDVAQAVVYLIGAPYTTGAVLNVDGGAGLG
jgi:pteridine reductase